VTLGDTAHPLVHARTPAAASRLMQVMLRGMLDILMHGCMVSMHAHMEHAWVHAHTNREFAIASLCYVSTVSNGGQGLSYSCNAKVYFERGWIQRHWCNSGGVKVTVGNRAASILWSPLYLQQVSVTAL
jgi:hypothetical protein